VSMTDNLTTETVPAAVRYRLPDGQQLAGLAWGSTDLPVLIALHGWLDNAASFNQLAPRLAQHYRVIALDLAGHGFSSHRPPGSDYNMLGYVVDLASLMETHFPEGARFLGHSLGGIVASLLASSLPETVHRLAMVDSLGPQVARPEKFADELSRAVRRRSEHRHSVVPEYATRDEAVAARCSGTLPLSREAAEAIVPRNLRRCEAGWSWRTDPRLRYPSLQKLTEEHVSAYMGAIRCPAIMLEADDGLLVKAGSMLADRYGAMEQLEVVTVGGSHHCHLDGDVANMADLLISFLQHN